MDFLMFPQGNHLLKCLSTIWMTKIHTGKSFFPRWTILCRIIVSNCNSTLLQLKTLLCYRPAWILRLKWTFLVRHGIHSILYSTHLLTSFAVVICSPPWCFVPVLISWFDNFLQTQTELLWKPLRLRAIVWFLACNNFAAIHLTKFCRNP